MRFIFLQKLKNISYGIYEEPNRKVIIIMVGTRENFYNELKKYIHK